MILFLHIGPYINSGEPVRFLNIWRHFNIAAFYMERKDSLSFSLDSAIGPYPGTFELSPHAHT